MLEENRKKELPPIYEPLLINCELLFTIANELEISDSERSRLDAMLRGQDESIFPVIPIDELYRFEKADDEEKKEAAIVFAGDTQYVPVQYRLYIPVQYLTDSSDIKVAISALSQTGTFDDWDLLFVDRNIKGDISSFTAVFENKEVKDSHFNEGDTVNVKFQVREDCNIPSILASFIAVKEKAADWLNTWDWLDMASSFTDTVSFKKVDK